MRGPFDIHTESVDGRVALTLSGRADAEAAGQLRAALAAVGPSPGQRLHLRLSGLHSCETVVAFDLLDFVREAKDAGAEVVLEDRPDPVVSTILLLADVRDDLDLRVDGARHGDGDGSGRSS